MGIFQIALIFATFLCSLVAGLPFVFALVVMPGIKSLNDREFIRAFQVMDGVIQNNQPILCWSGSVQLWLWWLRLCLASGNWMELGVCS